MGCQELSEGFQRVPGEFLWVSKGIRGIREFQTELMCNWVRFMYGGCIPSKLPEELDILRHLLVRIFFLKRCLMCCMRRMIKMENLITKTF